MKQLRFYKVLLTLCTSSFFNNNYPHSTHLTPPPLFLNAKKMSKARKKSYLTLLTILVSFTSVILANDSTSPAQPELIESSSYIIVFKPNTNSARISSQIQLMKNHLAHNNTSNTTASPKKEYNSIGNFKWYSGTFHAAALENLLSIPNRTTTDKNTTYNTNEDDAVHYYVKDTTFSLQEFIQTNPPSWV